MKADWQSVSTDVPVSDPSDVRLGHLIAPASLDGLEEDRRIILLGFPSDEGVRRNGGRPGAAAACDRIRHWLYRLTPDGSAWEDHRRVLEEMADLGNLRCSGDLEHDQQVLGNVVCELLRHQRMPVILGGGHETTFGHFLGYVRANQQVSIVNIDAHPDVRPLQDGRGHSGSPFRQALEHASGACRSYTVLGLNRFATAAAHLEYLHERQAEYCWSGQLTHERAHDAFQLAAPVLATFDLDVLDQESAPGVSAPNPQGISKSVWLTLARSAGRSAAVRSLDIVELNPRFDRDDQTARLAALTLWQFTRGLAERSASAG